MDTIEHFEPEWIFTILFYGEECIPDQPIWKTKFSISCSFVHLTTMGFQCLEYSTFKNEDIGLNNGLSQLFP